MRLQGSRGVQGEFTTPTIVLMAAAIAINIAVGYLVQTVLRLPIYLDSVGTVIVGALAGPWAGLATGFLANLIWGFTIGPNTIAPFAITAAVIGFMAGIFGRRGIFASSGSPRTGIYSALAGGLTGIVAAIVSAPIAFFVFGGTTGSGTDALVVLFRGIFDNAFAATFAQGVVSDPLDKLVTFLIVWALLLAVPLTVKTTFPQGEKTV
jgi:energy-coupling factor transport system substrate-specific component